MEPWLGALFWASLMSSSASLKSPLSIFRFVRASIAWAQNGESGGTRAQASEASRGRPRARSQTPRRYMASSEPGFQARSDARFRAASPLRPAAICWATSASALWYRRTCHDRQPPNESITTITITGKTSRHHRLLAATLDLRSSSIPWISINTRPRRSRRIHRQTAPGRPSSGLFPSTRGQPSIRRGALLAAARFSC